MGVLDTIIAMNKTANAALDNVFDSESLVNDLRPYTRDGITHIHVLDLSTGYKLVDGTWQELPPF